MRRVMSLLAEPMRLDFALLHPHSSVLPRSNCGQVYKLTHIATARCYIGLNKTVTLRERLQRHLKLSSGCLKIRNALLKYGPEAFTVQIMDFNVPEADLGDFEIARIDEFDAMHPTGFNLRPGGAQSPMKSELLRAKQRATKATPEGWKRSSDASKKTQNNPEVAAKKSASMKITCVKIRDKKSSSARIAMNRPETKAKHKAGCNTPIAKQNRGRATQKGWANEETRRKRSEGIAKAWVERRKNPEAAAKHKKACQEAGKRRREANVRKKQALLDNAL